MLLIVKSKFASERPFKLKNRKIIVLIINSSMNLNNKNCAKYTLHRPMGIENRIYREELKESLGMNFFSPFQTEREFKVYKSCKCSQIICSRVH